MTSEEDIGFYRNWMRESAKGISRTTLQRLVLLNVLCEFEVHHARGDAFQDWTADREHGVDPTTSNFILALTPRRLALMEESASLLFDEASTDWLVNVSERTARDYIRALQEFYI